VALDEAAELITIGDGVAFAAATVNTSGMAADCCGEPLSLTVTFKGKEPLAVGVPEMMPVDAERVSPDGKLPEVMLQVRAGVPPVATMLWL
jgi:hypothetical protein